MVPTPAYRPRARRATRIPFTKPGENGAQERFRATDRYRAEREWNRYEGTAQRDLYRELRERFLSRHVSEARWVLDVGAGPGRFTERLGGRSSRRVALDMSTEMLRILAEKWPTSSRAATLPDRVRADALRSPFLAGSFGEVAVLGNALGFAGSESDHLLKEVASLVAPGGHLVLEVAPGPGERSRYLSRLPPSAVARLFRSPPRALVPRIRREGFSVEAARRSKPGEFRRIAAGSLREFLRGKGWTVKEVMAVAPALGPDSVRTDHVRKDPKAWGHLLLVEEELGREPDRWSSAASVLLAAECKIKAHD